LKIKKSGILLASALILTSAVFFTLQYLFFHDARQTVFWLLQDFGFLPINVIVVTLFIDKFISLREKREKLERLNMLINDFFNEAGSDMIRETNRFISNLEELKQPLSITAQWDDKAFGKAAKAVEKAGIQADMDRADPYALKAMLMEKKKNILAMVENPSVLEHDRFSDMLWAVYHLEEELKEREAFESLPGVDKAHIAIDLIRAYRYLLIEWLYFNRYIKQRYPYLFSLMLRKSPFQEKDVVIRDQ
jgi:hypothetical protein